MELTLVGTRKVLDMPVPPTIVDDLISRFGVTGISAMPGVGKSFLALELSRAVVTGTDFLGKFPVKEGAVLFVGQDASTLDYARQARKIINEEYSRERPMGETNPFDDKLWWLFHQGIRLEDPEAMTALVKVANGIEHSWEGEPETLYIAQPDGTVEEVFLPPTKRGVSLIVLDTLSSFHDMEENSNDQMNHVFRNLRALADQTKAAVIVLHHHSYSTETNPGGRWRGASSQLGALDGHLELSPDSHDSSVIWLRIRKFRGVKIEDFAYHMETDHETATLIYRGQAGSADPLLEEVKELVKGTVFSFENKTVVEALMVKHPTLGRRALDGRVAKILKLLSTEGTIRKVSRGLWVRAVEPAKEETQ